MPHLGADGTIGDVGGVVGDVVLKLHLDLEMVAFATTRVQPVDDLHHHGIVFWWGGIVLLVGERAKQHQHTAAIEARPTVGMTQLF